MARVETSPSRLSWGIILTVLLLVALFPAWLGKFYATGDMRDLFIPLETFFRQEMLSGRLPVWHPDVAWGFPVIAAAQIGFFYPWLAAMRSLPISLYFPLTVATHLILLGLGTYLFLLYQKRTAPAAFLGSLAFALSAFVWQHITHFNIFLAIAWLPWQFLIASMIAKKTPLPWRDIILFGSILALPFLIGQFQIPLYLMIFSVAWFIYQRRHLLTLTTMINLGLIFLLVAVLTSVQILPTYELVGQSSRGAGGEFDVVDANQHSYPLYHLPTTFFPRFFGNDYTYWGKRLEIEHGFYIGIFPLLLSLWLIFRKNTGQNFWKILAVITFLLALGDMSPFRLIGLEPTFWFFSAPARWLLGTTFALCILAAAAFDQLRLNHQSFVRLAKIIAVVMVIIAVAANFILFVIPHVIQQLTLQAAQTMLPEKFATNSAYYEEKIVSLITSAQQSSLSIHSPFTAMALISLMAIPWLINRQEGLKILFTITSLELLIIALTTSPVIGWAHILSPPTTLQALPNTVLSKQSRLISIREGGDTGAFLTNPVTRADDHIRQQQRNLLVPLTHAQFGVAGIEWSASLDLQGHGEFLESLRPKSQYYVTDFAKLYELNVGGLVVPKDLQQPAFGQRTSDVNNINIYKLDHTPRASFYTHNQEKSDIPVKYETLTPTKISLEVNAPHNGVLLVRDSWYPGWHARLNDHLVEVTKVSPFFRQINLPAGQHHLIMSYKPQLVYVGLSITLATIVAILLVLGLTSKKLNFLR